MVKVGSTTQAILSYPKSCLLVSYIKQLEIKIYKTVILSVVLYGCGTWSLWAKNTDWGFL